MFGAARVHTLWAEKDQAKAGYLEAFRYQNETIAGQHNFRTGNLRDAQIDQWIHQRDEYLVPYTSPKGKKLIGGIRLLICERRKYSPLDFPIEKQTFEALERVFHLPPSTLAIFDNEPGSHVKFLSFRDAAKQELDRIGIVIKAPQKREILNHGLSLSYDVKTRLTTALLYGTDVPSFDNDASRHVLSPTIDPNIAISDAAREVQQRASAQHYLGPEPNSDFGQYIVSDVDRRYRADLVRLIEGAVSAWNHPLLLPTLLLTDHIQRTKGFCSSGKLLQETWAIEGELGVTYEGRANKAQETLGTNASIEPQKLTDSASFPFRRDKRRSRQSNRHTQRPLSETGSIGRGKVEKLSKRINAQSLRVLFTACSPQWNLGCSSSMRHLLDDLYQFLPMQLDFSEHDALKEMLEYNLATAESVGSQVATMKERMTLQLDVLYNMVAQMDNRLSARLAVSAGQDSTSMKILAFISAIYLPGSFVSSLFSTTMFQWPHSGDSYGSGPGGSGSGNGNVLSKLFWVYWATTIPLTAVTLIGWGIWWVFEMRRFKQDYAEVMEESTVDKVLQLARARTSIETKVDAQIDFSKTKKRIKDPKPTLEDGRDLVAKTSGIEAV